MAAAWVQDDNDFEFGANPVTIAFGSNVTAGNFALGGIFWLSTTITLTSVTKSAGTATIGTAVLVNNPTTMTTPAGRCAMFYVEITGTGSLTLALNFSASADGGGIIHEASGIIAAAPFVSSAMQAQLNPGTGTDALTSGTLSPAAASGDYLFGFFADVAIESLTFTQGTGFTIRNIFANAMFSESRVDGGSVATGTWTNANADAISGGMVLSGNAATGGSGPLILNTEFMRASLVGGGGLVI